MNNITVTTIEELKKLDTNLNIFTAGAEIDGQIMTAGLYQPVVMCGNSLVWGRRVIEAAEKAGLTSLNTVRITGTAEENMIVALKIENRPGGYTWEEKEKIYNYLMEDFRRKSSIQVDTCSLPGEISRLIEGNDSFQHSMENFTSLNYALKSGIKKGSLDLKTAVMVKDLPERISAFLLDKTEDVSFSQRRICLKESYEIWMAGGATEEKAVSLLEELKDIFDSNNPHETLHRKRYPNLSELYRAFQKIKNKKLAKSGIQLKEPSNFEGGAYQVIFNFRSKKELGKRADTLKALEEAADELFSLLR